MGEHQSYHEKITGEEAERRLKVFYRHCYLTRFSEISNCYVLSVYKKKKPDDVVLHFKIIINKLNRRLNIEGKTKEFENIRQLLAHYEQHRIDPALNTIGRICSEQEYEIAYQQEERRQQDNQRRLQGERQHQEEERLRQEEQQKERQRQEEERRLREEERRPREEPRICTILWTSTFFSSQHFLQALLIKLWIADLMVYTVINQYNLVNSSMLWHTCCLRIQYSVCSWIFILEFCTHHTYYDPVIHNICNTIMLCFYLHGVHC